MRTPLTGFLRASSLLLLLSTPLAGCGEADSSSDAPKRNAQVVRDTLTSYGVAAYVTQTREGAEENACAPAHPSDAEIEAPCTSDNSCARGESCRNVVQVEAESACQCLPNRACADTTCDPDKVCLPGTVSQQLPCGSGPGNLLCADTCVLGTCTTDDECGADARCIVVRSHCGTVRGTTCTSRTGNGCLGVADACGAHEVCVPELDGTWGCVEDVYCW